MATTTIPWGDGSGDNIYLTYSSASGDQTVEVSSDANTGSARTQTVTFTAGNVSQTMTVNQDAGMQQHTVTLYPSSYDTVNYSRYSWSDLANGYASASSSSRATIICNTKGSEAYIYYKFDTSQIPDGATIVSVECKVKVGITGNTTQTPIKQVQMFTGLTPKGNTTTVTGTSASTYTLNVGEWTLSELRDIRVRPYMQEGANTTSRYGIYFYGATLTITYAV